MSIDPGQEEVVESTAPAERKHDVLVVSESPEFVAEAHKALRPSGARVIACLGPAQAPCYLDDEGSCPLAGHCAVVFVDSPPSGVFTCHSLQVQAGAYAERLQRAHPKTLVLLAGAPVGTSGPTGEVAQVADRDSGLDIVRSLLSERGLVRAVADGVDVDDTPV